MINAVGRDIPEEILEKEYIILTDIHIANTVHLLPV